jgi:hypothetical protein
LTPPPNEALKVHIKEIHTCGKRSSGFAFGPLLGATTGCGARAGGFAALPLAGPWTTWATGGTSACSGIPWYCKPTVKMTTTIIIYKQTQHIRVKYSCNKLKSHQKGREKKTLNQNIIINSHTKC